MLRSNKYEEYNKNSSLQKRVISENNFVYKNHLSYLSGIRDKKVLDVGCGTGNLLFSLNNFRAFRNLSTLSLGILITPKIIKTKTVTEK